MKALKKIAKSMIEFIKKPLPGIHANIRPDIKAPDNQKK